MDNNTGQEMKQSDHSYHEDHDGYLKNSFQIQSSELIKNKKKEKTRSVLLFIGTRGIPATYGGFETCVEELSERLSKKYEIVVYARKAHYKNQPRYFNNARIVYLPALNKKSLETISHTFLSIIHALLFYRNAIFLIFNAANSPVLLFPWFLRRKMVINTDGLEWKRDKWGRIGRFYYQFAEWLSSKFVKYIITDSIGMHDYYLTRWKRESRIIEYGAHIEISENITVLDQFSLKPNEYILQITRLEPENNPLLTVEAFIKLKKDNNCPLKLIIIGDLTYPSNYSQKVKSYLSEDIIMPGYIFDKNILKELRANCLAYIHGNQVGGTNPALLEAMGAGAFILTRDVIFNREVLTDGGLYYKRTVDDLASKLLWIWKNQEKKSMIIQIAQKRISTYYNWDRIANEYDKLINIICIESDQNKIKKIIKKILFDKDA